MSKDAWTLFEGDGLLQAPKNFTWSPVTCLKLKTGSGVNPAQVLPYGTSKSVTGLVIKREIATLSYRCQTKSSKLYMHIVQDQLDIKSYQLKKFLTLKMPS